MLPLSVVMVILNHSFSTSDNVHCVMYDVNRGLTIKISHFNARFLLTVHLHQIRIQFCWFIFVLSHAKSVSQINQLVRLCTWEHLAQGFVVAANGANKQQPPRQLLLIGGQELRDGSALLIACAGHISDIQGVDHHHQSLDRRRKVQERHQHGPKTGEQAPRGSAIYIQYIY